MPNVTNIEWTATVRPDGTTEPGFTSNPVKYRDADGKSVWACAKKSPGCMRCYAETLAKRYGRGGPFTKAVLDRVTPYVCEDELKALLRSKKLAGKKVFVADMTDAFGEWVTDDMLDRLFATFAFRRDVTFQVLTKRADRLCDYLTGLGRSFARLEAAARSLGVTLQFEGVPLVGWPLRNVWAGFSAENQEWFDRRAAQTAPLMRAGWTVFVSAEPLLGPILMRGWDGKVQRNWLGEDGIRLVIAGGESGPGARTCELDWIRSLVRQCREAGASCFVKQLGASASDPKNGVAGRSLSVASEAAPLISLRLKSAKGGDMLEWPTDLRVRQLPEVSP